MLKLTILLVVLACAIKAALPEGLQPQLEGRVVEGDPTSIASNPWQISLQRSGYHICGGSIYSSQIVVTAAHCLNSSLYTLRVRVGSSFWIHGGVLASVAKYKRHPKFNPKTYNYDIGVIRLTRPLSWSSTIRPIRLTYSTPKNGAAARVSGWGITAFSSVAIPTQLQYVDLKIVSRRECASSAYDYGSLISDNMICTYTDNKDACKGDSGGPLVSGGLLVGVVSWGINCALPRHPGVYANVAVLRSWIVRAAYTISV